MGMASFDSKLPMHVIRLRESVEAIGVRAIRTSNEIELVAHKSSRARKYMKRLTIIKCKLIRVRLIESLNIDDHIRFKFNIKHEKKDTCMTCM